MVYRTGIEQHEGVYKMMKYVVWTNLDSSYSVVLLPEGYDMGTYRGKDAERNARRAANYRNEAVDEEDAI